MPLVRRMRRLAGSPVLHFALSGLLVFAAVAWTAVQLAGRASRDEALRDAQNVSRIAGEGIVAPYLGTDVLAGDPRALARLDQIVRARVLRAPVVRVKVWRRDGTILYSDDRRLIGERYPLGVDEQRILDNDGIEAEVSDLNRPENRFERPYRRLREVYLGVRPAAGGAPVLFEEYLRDSSISASQSRILKRFVPILLAALLLLELTQLPLAASLTRRLRRGQRDRERLLGQAAAASEKERQRIARELHDGVVQELAAISYDLSAAATALEEDPAAARAALQSTGGQVRQTLRRLRSSLVELYPESLGRLGLHGAISDLLAGLEAHQITTHLDFDEDIVVDATAQAIVFRTAREALRNVAVHAYAHDVHVSFGAQQGSTVLAITDDGSGLPPDVDDRPRFGLRMLDDLAREQGGELQLESAPGRGTTLRLTLPRRR
ncbi:MAG: two-component sensor histidine kinase [Solirubrobacterales bacterium]|nr:two-component sensor histidine kinase [Solirubrobacterales bacterium]